MQVGSIRSVFTASPSVHHPFIRRRVIDHQSGVRRGTSFVVPFTDRSRLRNRPSTLPA